MQSSSHHDVQWFVGLSNGENAHEGVGRFEMVPGEPSPWQRLLRYVAQEKLEITSICLRTADGRSYSLPSAGRNPKFKAFADAPKPYGYNFFRKMAADVVGSSGSEPDRFTVIVALYPTFVAELWVDERTLNCWVLTR